MKIDFEFSKNYTTHALHILFPISIDHKYIGNVRLKNTNIIHCGASTNMFSNFLHVVQFIVILNIF